MYFETRDLTVGYHEKPLIKHINIGIPKGGILCLVGPNGSGKSTILRSITRHLTSLGGCAYIDGRDIFRMSSMELARHVSVVLTERVDPELLTCREVIAVGRYPYTGHFGRLSPEDEKIVEESMALVHVAELCDRHFSELSDGQRQRVLLARALCQKPEVIVMDEPTSYLDIRHKIELMNILRDLTSGQGLSVVLSLHEVDLAAKLADEVVLVKDGTILCFGAPEDVLDTQTVSGLYDIHDGMFNMTLGSVELMGAMGEPSVFVVPGEGRGAMCYRVLQKKGTPFATGILQKGSVDYHAASTLAARTFEAPAFGPASEKVLFFARETLKKCACVVDSGTEFGPYNQENLELLILAEANRIPVFSLRETGLLETPSARCFSSAAALAECVSRSIV